LKTDRLDSGPPRAGNTDALLTKPGLKTSVHQGPESFAKLLEGKPPAAAPREERAPHEDSPVDGKTEVSSRKPEHLSVKMPKERVGTPSTAKLKPETKADAKAMVKDSKAQTDDKATTDQKAMLEFMDSMESEFSIPPERIVGAMAELDLTDLSKPAHETATQIIQKLDLPPEETEKAQALYLSMLAQLEPSPVAQLPEKTLSAVVIAPGAEMRLTAMTEGQQEGPAAKSAADSFFPQVAVISTTQQKSLSTQQLQALAQELHGNIDRDMTNLRSVMQTLQALPSHTDSPPEAQAVLAALAELDVSAMAMQAQAAPQQERLSADDSASLAANAQLASRMEALQNSLQSSRATTQMVAAGYQDIADAPPSTSFAMAKSTRGGKTETGPSFFSDFAAAPTTEVVAVGAGGVAVRATSQKEQGSPSEGQFGRQNQEDPTSDTKATSNRETALADSAAEAFAAPQKLPLNPTAGALATGVPVVHSQHPTQNLDQIVNQAQVMAHKGGGEAIVKMNPDGLGEIHLRVTVLEGKVNVQMSASTREAKEILEASMKELKTSLAGHNLKIDHLKVDVGNQANADGGGLKGGDRGFQMNQQRDQARQAQQQFADGQPRRANFVAGETFSERPVLAPAPALARRYVGEGRGSGLNLVA